jgi:hypothetical protein
MFDLAGIAPLRASLNAEALDDLNYRASISAVTALARTSAGAAAVEAIMRAPVTDVPLLRRRQQYIATVDSHAGDMREIRAALQDLARYEEGARWCCRDCRDPGAVDEDEAAALRRPYFGLAPLDASWQMLWLGNSYTAYAAPLLAIATPLFYIIAPYLIIRVRLRVRIDIVTYLQLLYHSVMGAGEVMRFAVGRTATAATQALSAACSVAIYAQTVLAALKHATGVRETCRRIAARYEDAAAYCELAHRAVSIGVERCGGWAGDAFLRSWIGEAPRVAKIPRASGGPEVNPWNTGFAECLQHYAALDADALRDAVRAVGCLDAVLAFSDARRRYGLAVAGLEGPGIVLSGCWGLTEAASATIALPAPVQNDVVLLTRGTRARAMLITGANASGKTTLMRTVAGCALMAQTIGMCPARAASLRPLAYICTMMCIRDDPDASTSRFQAELLRAGACMDAAAKHPRAPGLVVMDEIFGGSTDAEGGEVCASRVLGVLLRQPGCAFVLATHSTGVALAASRLPGVRMFRTAPDRPYAIEPGVRQDSNSRRLMDAVVERRRKDARTVDRKRSAHSRGLRGPRGLRVSAHPPSQP